VIPGNVMIGSDSKSVIGVVVLKNGSNTQLKIVIVEVTSETERTV